MPDNQEEKQVGAQESGRVERTILWFMLEMRTTIFYC